MKKIQQEWTILEKDLPGKHFLFFFFFFAFAKNLAPCFRHVLFELQGKNQCMAEARCQRKLKWIK